MMVSIIILLSILTLVLSYSFYRVYKIAYELNHPKRFLLSPNICIPILYRKFDFRTRDGLVLKGIDIKPKMKVIGTILVCHYLGGSKELILTFVDCLLRVGFRIITFDFRNHGESQQDKRVRFSLEEDFTAFYETIKEMDIEGPFGIIGFSMGATPALFGFSRYHDIKAAVIDSGPLIFVKEYFVYILNNKNIQNPIYRVFFLLLYLYHAGFNRMSQKTVGVLKALRGKPILLIHGGKDNIIPIENARTAYDHLKSDKSSMWVIPNSRHLTNRFLRKDEYEKRLIDFFHGYLCDSRPE